MGKTNRARYTLEFKLEAVRLIGAGQSIAATAAILGRRFFIGAHAAVSALPVLTRDPRRYKNYFPSVKLVTPAADVI